MDKCIVGTKYIDTFTNIKNNNSNSNNEINLFNLQYIRTNIIHVKRFYQILLPNANKDDIIFGAHCT